MRKLSRPLFVLALCAILLFGFAGEAFAIQTTSQAVAQVPQEAAPAPVPAETQSSLSAPQNFAASKVSKSSVALKWDKVKGAKQYKIYSSADETGTFKLVTTAKTNKYTHKVKLGNATRYYVVRAVNGKDSGPLSSKLAVSLPGTAPKVVDTSAIDAEYAKIVNPMYVISGLDQKYLDGLNADRAANGIAPVEYRAALSTMAMVKAADTHAMMAAGGAFPWDHVSAVYGHPSEMGEKYLGYPVAENIMDATGPWFDTYSDAAACGRDQFMNSATHRATRLDPKLKYVGFAFYYDGDRLLICEQYSLQ